MNSIPASPLPMIEIRLQRLPNGGGLPVPAYASDGAAGMDIVAAETLTLRPGARHAVATGFAMAIPAGYEAVSYTHLDVYKRQPRLYEHPFCLQNNRRLWYLGLLQWYIQYV